MTRVLVPVEVLEGETVSAGLVRLLGTVDVTILGYHVLPEQTPPDQARLQYEERATDALEDLSEEFASAGSAVEHRLVFTHNRQQTIDRVTTEIDANAFVIPGMTGPVDDLLVSLSGGVNIDRILGFVTELIDDRDIDVSLFLTASDDEADPDRLDAAAERLRSAGITVRTERETTETPFEALMGVVPGHDVIVMGESAPSLRSLVFGDEAERVASASVGPVIVVRSNEQQDT